MKKIILLIAVFYVSCGLSGQDTTIVQTFTLDSASREGVFQFPDDPGVTYEKIIMQYRMRCHDAQVGNGNVGCYEWDYHCNTVVTDSSKTDSLRSTHPSHIIVGSDSDPYYYVLDPTFTYYQFVQQEVLYDQILSEDSAMIGNGSQVMDFPFSTSTTVGKSRFLLTASELSNAGLTAGDITGLRLNLTSTGSAVDFLKIRIKNTSKTELNPLDPDVDGFSEVYFLNTDFQNTGEHSFNFYDPFNWDGASNLIIELSFTNENAGTDNSVLGENSSFNSSIHTDVEDGYLSFSMGDYIEVPPDAFASVDSFLTISFWQFGDPDIQPYNSYLFEGGDASNNRVVNCHMPWSNSRIYWDAGNSGTSSYDRIDKDASPNEYSGQWNHWALVKNAATGEMKMYLNGELWHSGTGKTRLMSGVTKFTIAGNDNPEGRWGGYIDDFQVWETELDQSEIQDWMFQNVDASHPQYDKLLFYYRFDELTGDMVTDHSPNGYDGQISGQPLSISKKGHQLSANFSLSQLRPNIELVQGVYQQTINNYTYFDSLQNPYNTVYDFYVQNNDLTPNDTNTYWEAGYMDVIDESGIVVDSVFIEPLDSINIETLTYYQKWPMRYELLSFITPYGNGLDLGQEGKMWEFDVTDFTHVLKGEKFLSIEGVGRWSEEYDIRFLFIEGTPVRNVISIDQIWPIRRASGVWYGFGWNEIYNDTKFEPREVTMNPSGSYYKVRSSVTGHGQQGEFNAKFHYIDIDTNQWDFVYKVWNECSEIPVYPQGGTWIYDRAGWCPGDPTTLFEFDITDLVTPGETHVIDYGLQNVIGLNEANYRIANQLVTYGPANHNLDAAIVKVGKPNSAIAAYERFNPACMNPAVYIMNAGTDQVNSLELEYFITGGDPLTYSWNGTLDFLDTAMIELPVNNNAFWVGSENQFIVNIVSTNGQGDDYPNNDAYSTVFETVDNYGNNETLILECKTNNYGFQTSYMVTDATGYVLLERDNLDNNAIYTDELNFAEGCYKIRIDDSADDGLYWWHNSNQGTGYFRLKDGDGNIIENFEPEFGGFMEYEFAVFNATGIQDHTNSRILSLYPSPFSDLLNIELKGFEDSEAKVVIMSMDGTRIREERISIDLSDYHKKLNMSELPAGIYLLKIETGNYRAIRKIVKR